MVTGRWFRHLGLGPSAARWFPADTLDAIQHAIAEQERDHLGEICFAVEGRLGVAELIRCPTARDRAQEVFGQLRVWDTAHDTGVLVYVLLADRAIEIVVDRAVAAKVDQREWDGVCTLMRDRFTAGEYRAGAIAGVEAVAAILRRHFPADRTANPEELPDRPVLL
jgi:uncharacterized membrane protein